MADLPEKIACPTCGRENSPSAKTCAECASDLTVVVGVISTATRHYNSALRLAEEGMVDHAIIEAETATELWDKNAYFHNLLGTLYAKKGLLDKAVAEWKKTLSLDPTMAKAADNIEKARKLELLQSERASRRPYYIAIGVLAVLALVFLVWAGYSHQRMRRLSGRVTVLEQDRQDLAALRQTHHQTSERLAAAHSIIEASGVAEASLRGRLAELETETEDLVSQLGQKERQVADQSSEIALLNKRVTELENRPTPPPLISPQDLKALRNDNAAMKASIADMEQSVKAKEGELDKATAELNRIAQQLDQQGGKLRATEDELARTRTALESNQQRAASLEERVEALNKEIRRWDLRNAEMSQVIRLTQDQRYEEAKARLEEVRGQLGAGPLSETVASVVDEGLHLAQDPFERELRWYFAEQRREKELQLRKEFADRHLDTAQQLFREGMYYKALGELDTTETIDPGHRGVEELRQRILGEQEKAETNVTDIINGADEAMAAHDLDEARRLVERAVREFPEHPLVLDRLARLEEMEEEVKEARRSEEDEYREDMADLRGLLDQRKLAEVLRLLEILERKYPEDPELARIRSTTEGKIQDRMDRIPQDLVRAEELFIERKYSEVVGLMDDVLRWDPENKRATMLREVSAERLDLLQAAFAAAADLYQEGRYEEARAAVERILSAQPHHAGARELESEIKAALRDK